MKTIIIALIVAIALGSGYYLFAKKTSNTDYNSDASEVGKLDINVVCESSLSYMTFADGASADKFVAECKEGKHPEVIEHYKAQMNLGDGAAI